MAPIIAWANLWKAFTGIRRDRTLLTLWEWSLGVDLAFATWLGGHWGWAWALGGFLLGSATAFVRHELLFQWFATEIVGLRELDVGEEMGRTPGFISMLERWTGPVA